MREIDWRIKSIIARRNLDMKFEAQLHGAEIKIPKPESNSKPIEMTKDEEQAMEQAFADAKLRKSNGRR